jgi:hypothetical protein
MFFLPRHNSTVYIAGYTGYTVFVISMKGIKIMPEKTDSTKRKPAMAKPAAPARRPAAPTAAKAASAKAAAKPAKKEKKTKKGNGKIEPKMKVIRDSFTMPQNDFVKISELKQACMKAGVQVKKSELLRAGLHALGKLSVAQLKQTIAQMEQIKTGRPKKD